VNKVLERIISEAKYKGYMVLEKIEYQGENGIIKSFSFERSDHIYLLYLVDTFEKKAMLSKIANADIASIKEGELEDVLRELEYLL